MTVGQCRSCGANVLWAKTPAGKAMPLEYDMRNVPDGMTLNVAYTRTATDRVTCLVLTADMVSGAAPLDVVEEALGSGYLLTVAHFVTCPQADIHRRARRGEVPGVVPFPTARDRNQRGPQ